MHSPTLHPYRAEIRTTLAAFDMADATRRHDALMKAAEELGFYVELGAIGVMDEGDVVEDSPLAEALAVAGAGA